MQSKNQPSNRYSLILGSKSPRRKELLGWLDIPFEVRAKDIDEVSRFKHPKDVVEDIARQKGQAVYEDCAKDPRFGKDFFPLIVASDTIVTLGERIFGKPTDVSHAREMLLTLAGKSHQVLTAVHLSCFDLKNHQLREYVFSCQTEVEFEPLTSDILENYLGTGESLDKAGAYGIQKHSLTFISRVSGSYSNVVGFPLAEFIIELKKFLGQGSDTTGEWRELIHGGRKASSHS